MFHLDSVDTGKATEVGAKFLRNDGVRQVPWVERSTGEHPEDNIAGDDSAEFQAREAYLVHDSAGPCHCRMRRLALLAAGGAFEFARR